jgi:hypothetical protein
MREDAEFKESLQHIYNLVRGAGCTWSCRFGRGPGGSDLTCSEYRTRDQGSPTPLPGCFLCEARKFLKRHGYKEEDLW